MPLFPCLRCLPPSRRAPRGGPQLPKLDSNKQVICPSVPREQALRRGSLYYLQSATNKMLDEHPHDPIHSSSSPLSILPGHIKPLIGYMTCISHPLIRPDSIESREYQLAIAMKALDANTMVILPTGLGKTAIALLVAASRLYNEGGRVLMLAPTKPLVEQHLRFFEKFLIAKSPAGSEDIPVCNVYRGCPSRGTHCRLGKGAGDLRDTTSGEKRSHRGSLYLAGRDPHDCRRMPPGGRKLRVCLSGPAVSRHRSINPCILAMTASPGGAQEKVQDVCANLGITQIENRTENDPDVRPYVYERDIGIHQIDLPGELKASIHAIHTLIDDRLALLASLGFSVPKRDRLSMKELKRHQRPDPAEDPEPRPGGILGSIGLRGVPQAQACRNPCRIAGKRGL